MNEALKFALDAAIDVLQVAFAEQGCALDFGYEPEELRGAKDTLILHSRELRKAERLARPWRVGDEVATATTRRHAYDNGHIEEIRENGLMIVAWHKWGRNAADQIRVFLRPDNETDIYHYGSEPLELVKAAE